MSRQTKLAAVYSEGKSLSVYDTANSEWLDLPGLLDFTESGGEKDSRSTGTDSTRPHGVTSNLKAPMVEATFKFVSSPHWDVVDTALVNDTILAWRFDTAGETVNDFADQSPRPQVAIAANGACTFTNGSALTADDFPLGACIKVGSTLYPIRTVSVSGSTVSVSVNAITSAVSASDFTTETSGERVSFRGKPTMAPTRQHGVAQQSEREGTLSIQALSVLPKPVRIA